METKTYTIRERIKFEGAHCRKTVKCDVYRNDKCIASGCPKVMAQRFIRATEGLENATVVLNYLKKKATSIPSEITPKIVASIRAGQLANELSTLI